MGRRTSTSGGRFQNDLNRTLAQAAQQNGASHFASSKEVYDPVPFRWHTSSEPKRLAWRRAREEASSPSPSGRACVMWEAVFQE